MSKEINRIKYEFLLGRKTYFVELPEGISLPVHAFLTDELPPWNVIIGRLPPGRSDIEKVFWFDPREPVYIARPKKRGLKHLS